MKKDGTVKIHTAEVSFCSPSISHTPQIVEGKLTVQIKQPELSCLPFVAYQVAYYTIGDTADT